mmetsp:Transcript_104996/g.306771  ORF Transcript_104996/g.306771 Transcript_104996/m.306771 type:complete len:285 (+) Transcript_104996:483-1337(+)
MRLDTGNGLQEPHFARAEHGVVVRERVVREEPRLPDGGGIGKRVVHHPLEAWVRRSGQDLVGKIIQTAISQAHEEPLDTKEACSHMRARPAFGPRACSRKGTAGACIWYVGCGARVFCHHFQRLWAKRLGHNSSEQRHALATLRSIVKTFPRNGVRTCRGVEKARIDLIADFFCPFAVVCSKVMLAKYLSDVGKCKVAHPLKAETCVCNVGALYRHPIPEATQDPRRAGVQQSYVGICCVEALSERLCVTVILIKPNLGLRLERFPANRASPKSKTTICNADKG